MTIAVKVLNTETMETYDYQSIAHAKNAIIPLSARSGYTFKVVHAQTEELIGNIRPNPRRYKTNKATARFIRSR